MLRDFRKLKIKKDDFDNLSLNEKRAYLLQEEQYETMWWSRTANKFIVIFGGISSIIAFFLIALKK